ncbi:MAG: septal ring lytic transglycosylase RlpA family protein [Deltaproteobacteria bacterium]|nr:septal ring lytic transglycosylase RlpA family protein [Deltaproteobacteria bacterium]
MKGSSSYSRTHFSGKKLALCLLLFFAACAPRKEVSYEPLGDGKSFRYKEIGIASWYGKEYHGRNTSNGEIYNMYAMTAAHPTLPFHTLVRVTNLENGKGVEVRINDRGPFVEGRVIDLSYTGAQTIEMLGKGTAKVVVEATLPADGNGSPLEGTFAIQVGAFAEKENAERFQRELERRFSRVHTVLWESNQRRIYRVRLGGFRTEAEARSYLQILKRDNISGRVVRED